MSWTRLPPHCGGPGGSDRRLVLPDADRPLLCCGQTLPGASHDLAQVRQAGLVELLALIPGVTLLADAGYQGLSTPTAGAVLTPRPARRKNQVPVFPAVAAAHEAERLLATAIPVIRER